MDKDDFKTFTLQIKDGYFYWQIILNDDTTHQILVRKKQKVSPKGNKYKVKEYFIRINDKELIFDDEVKKMFRSFIYPYCRCGI